MTAVPLIIHGKEEYDPSASFEVVSPYTNTPCWTTASASISDAQRACDSSASAFPTWATTKPTVRRDILLKAADLLEERLVENASFMRTEMGADIGASQMFVVPLGIRMLRDVAGRITSICGGVPVVEAEGQSAMVVKEPMGVILGITPWYFPRSIPSSGSTEMTRGTPRTSSGSDQQHVPSQPATPPSSNPPNSPRDATTQSPAHHTTQGSPRGHST